MVHTEVYKRFNDILPQDSKHVEAWFPNGRNSIRLRMLNKREYVFTYNDSKDWHFETIKSYLARIERRTK